jgi:hypothetical protein
VSGAVEHGRRAVAAARLGGDVLTVGALASLAQALFFASDLEETRQIELEAAELGIVYLTCWIFLGMAMFRKGHYWLFWIGFLFPIPWIVGALIAPTERDVARAAGMA